MKVFVLWQSELSDCTVTLKLEGYQFKFIIYHKNLICFYIFSTCMFGDWVFSFLPVLNANTFHHYLWFSPLVTSDKSLIKSIELLCRFVSINAQKALFHEISWVDIFWKSVFHRVFAKWRLDWLKMSWKCLLA